MPVITISRELGSKGTPIAEEVARQLNAQCFNKEILAHIARQAGVPVEVVIEEEERLISRQMAVGMEFHSLFNERRTELDNVLNEDSYIQQMRNAIETLAAENEDMVFIGRGAQMVLSHKDSRILHVHLYASHDCRIRRIQEWRGIDDYEEARQVIHHADLRRRDWYRRFYAGANWKDPRYYHLMINTSRLPVNVAAELIVQASRSGLGSDA